MASNRRSGPPGSYRIDHKSFGQMMVSEQLRPALILVCEKIALSAKANSIISGSGGQPDNRVSAKTRKLADSYQLDRGPLVIIKSRAGIPSARISHRVINTVRYAAVREFGAGGFRAGRGTRDLRRAGTSHGNLARESGGRGR